MSEFGIVEDTMFIPMVGRIYATEKFPGILYDKKALSLKEKLPSALLETGNQSQYTWKQEIKVNTRYWLLHPVPLIWIGISRTS